ncbi:hypothetical protein [Sphingomonas oleivorans]|uniref:hypothetical protein n=1 Tax=Sphingomonas oleivorans TaxID=1735121 RepID=UPI0013FD6108|nr:hypothetical protein [Sphingomonas oleivorans]
MICSPATISAIASGDCDGGLAVELLCAQAIRPVFGIFDSLGVGGRRNSDEQHGIKGFHQRRMGSGYCRGAERVAAAGFRSDDRAAGQPTKFGHSYLSESDYQRRASGAPIR